VTEKELEVISLYAEGKTYKEIAVLLYIGEWTVKQHIKNIARKLNLKPRACIVYLVKKGLINPKLNEVLI